MYTDFLRYAGQPRDPNGEFGSGKKDKPDKPDSGSGAVTSPVESVVGTHLDPPPESGKDITTEKAAAALIAKGPSDSHPTYLMGDPVSVKPDSFDGHYSESVAGRVKADVASRLAQNTKATTTALQSSVVVDSGAYTVEDYLDTYGKEDAELRQDAASTLVSNWAGTSNDSSPGSLAMQESAIKEFGLQDTLPWETGPTITDSTKTLVQKNGQTNKAFLRAMYDDTQKMFKEQGVKSITLYRGQTVAPPGIPTEDTPDGWKPLEVQTAPGVVDKSVYSHADAVQLRPMSSWSSDFLTAQGFANDYGVVMSAQVPVSQILSTPRTGFGCLDEREFVVLGNVQDVTNETV